jgi:gluconokinase
MPTVQVTGSGRTAIMPRGFLIMGVSGCGKTSVGQALATKLGWTFFDGDDYHPSANIQKMAQGIPLEDADRLPWLAILHDLLSDSLNSGGHPILACSALKERYRQILLAGNRGVAVVHLKGSFDLISSRMQARQEHYMKPAMLKSQFEALEEPDDAITIDISLPVERIAEEISRRYS